MRFILEIFEKKSQASIIDDNTLIEANACPNCWGKLEYADQYVSFAKDRTKSNVSVDKSGQKAFVQQFLETHVTGIQLKREGDNISIPKWKGSYKHFTTKAN